jgi:hypothetical protein
MAEHTIHMDINETLELDYLVEQISNDTIKVSDEPSSGATSLNYVREEYGVFDPAEPGTYKLEINGQKIEIKVTKIVESAIANYTADGFTGSTWESNIGPNLSVQGTDEPFAVTNKINGHNAVRFNYTENNNHAVSSKFSADSTNDEDFGFVWVMRKRAADIGEHPIDGGFDKELSCYDRDGGYDYHRNGNNGKNGALNNDTNWHVFYLRAFGGGDNVEFQIDGSTSSGSVQGSSGLSGLTVGERGDLNGDYNTQADYAEITVIKNGSLSDFEDEVSRLGTKYSI